MIQRCDSLRCYNGIFSCELPVCSISYRFSFALKGILAQKVYSDVNCLIAGSMELSTVLSSVISSVISAVLSIGNEFYGGCCWF